MDNKPIKIGFFLTLTLPQEGKCLRFVCDGVNLHPPAPPMCAPSSNFVPLGGAHLKASNHAGFKQFVPLVPLVPLMSAGGVRGWKARKEKKGAQGAHFPPQPSNHAGFSCAPSRGTLGAHGTHLHMLHVPLDVHNQLATGKHRVHSGARSAVGFIPHCPERVALAEFLRQHPGGNSPPGSG